MLNTINNKINITFTQFLRVCRMGTDLKRNFVFQWLGKFLAFYQRIPSFSAMKKKSKLEN